MVLAHEHSDDLNGHLAGQGATHSIGDLPVHRLCSFTWWFFTKDADSKSKDKFKAALWRPPSKTAPIPKESPWSPENEMKAFSALRMETGA